MAEQTRLSAKGKNGASPIDFADVSKMFLTLPKLQAHSIHALLEQQREFLGFLGSRCEADLALVDRIAKAEELTDVVEAYRGFWQGAAKDYAAEAKRSVEIGTKSAAELRDELVEMAPRPQPVAA